MEFGLSARHARRGLTLVELVIVIAILAVLSAVVTVSFSRYTGSQALTGAAAVIVSDLEDARSRTLSSQGASQYGVHLASGAVTLFRGDTYAAGDPNNEATSLDGRVVVTPALAGGGADVVFERLTGETDTPGTITLTLSGNAALSRTITVEQTGLLSYDD